MIRFAKFLAGLAMSVLLCLGFAGGSFAASGPFSGPNGKLATIRFAPEEGTYLGSVSAGGAFHPLYEEWDYNLGGSRLAFSPDGARIALSIGWRPSELAIANATSGGLRYVDTHRIQAYDPFWAPGGRIVFSGKTLAGKRVGTYLVRPDGSGFRKLFERVALSASRDLGEFVSMGRSGGENRLLLLDREGKRSSLLDRSRKFYFRDPEISPDGRWIVYERYFDPTGKYSGTRQGDLFVIRTDGTHRRRLTSGLRDRYPAFSPDGKWVAFARHDPKTMTSNLLVLSVKRPGNVHQITSGKDDYYYEVSWGRRQQPAE